MAKKVLKFGGTSVGTIERILHVAKIIKKEYDAGNEVIAVVSAMSGKTNELLKQSRTISEDFDKRELDVLVTSGEQVTSSLLSGALIELGVKAKSWMNWQIPIITEGEHSNSRIINMNVEGVAYGTLVASTVTTIIFVFYTFHYLSKMTSLEINVRDVFNVNKILVVLNIFFN